ncbi:hypothetical protein [Paenibacillus caui]|uniref:hypothetical protein n=1 Tax=Paenibacillus caui TaxID=2873927 RepID=UPI001CA88275|nr:hypothetical protein [Paenibacillus caui]
MVKELNFTEIFNTLKAILEQYESEMDLKVSTNEQYYLDTFKINPINKKICFFASTMIKKNYVSYYLMPVYAYPELLSGISDDLKKRMQGKSCFNFKQEDKALFEELKKLTHKGYLKYKEENLI